MNELGVTRTFSLFASTSLFVGLGEIDRTLRVWDVCEISGFPISGPAHKQMVIWRDFCSLHALTAQKMRWNNVVNPVSVLSVLGMSEIHPLFLHLTSIVATARGFRWPSCNLTCLSRWVDCDCLEVADLTVTMESHISELHLEIGITKPKIRLFKGSSNAYHRCYL